MSNKPHIISDFSKLHLIFGNPILFAICTSTFSKLCKKTYVVACRRELRSAPLQLIGSRPLVAFGERTYKLNLKN
jgi:hypothetical protein